MATNIEKFIHQNTKTSHKRWESIVMYALHYSLRDVELLSQYSIGPYLVDGYFPDLNLVLEIDEEHHDAQFEKDQAREYFITEQLKCEFYRINIKEPVYEQIDDLIAKVKSLNPRQWTIKNKIKKVGEYSRQKREELEAAGAFEYLNELQEELESLLDIKIDTNHIGTPITPQNGEIGFMINFDGLTLSLLMTKSLKPKLLVTKYGEKILELLSLNLSNWKNETGYKYRVIEDFKGQKTKAEIVNYLKEINRLLRES